MVIDTRYAIGDRVTIDGDKGLVGIIVAIEVRPGNVIRYEVAWVTHGDAKWVVLDEFRLNEHKD